MKRAISFLLALLLMTSCFVFRSPEANALGAVWVKEYYTDKFGDKTDQFYITNKSQFKGTYNSDSDNEVKLGAKLIFERDGDELFAYLSLFLDRKNELRFATFSHNYDISVKRADGSVFDTTGVIDANENRLQITDSTELADALQVYDGTVKIYIEDSSNSNNNYLFVIDCGNFKALYEKEILIPYQEEKNQAEEHLQEEKKLDKTAEMILDLDDYEDTAKKNKEELLIYQQQNMHVIGLLDIPDTEIHYPILQHPTEDNYYLQTAVDGKPNKRGSIYTNLMEGQNFDTFNTVIYGMNLSDGGMFTSLKDYDDLDYMKSHREIHIYTDREDHIYQVCADVIYDDRYITYVYNDARVDDRASYLRSLRHGVWLDDVIVDTSSHIITLSTGIGGMPNNRRLIIAVEQEVKNISEITG